MIRIYTHTDRDGIVAGAVVYNFFRNLKHWSEDGKKIRDITQISRFANVPCEIIDRYVERTAMYEIDVHKMGYNSFSEADIKSDGDDLVIVTDLSIDAKGENAVFKLIKNHLECGNMVIWMDHHQSSIEYLTNNTDLTKYINEGLLMPVIDVKKCGAKIAWDCLWKKLSNCDSKTIDYIDDYDRWVFNLPDTEAFGYGYDYYIKEALSYKPTSKFIWDLLLCDLARNQTNEGEDKFHPHRPITEYVHHEMGFWTRFDIDTVIQKGEIIKTYQEGRWAETYKRNGMRYKLTILNDSATEELKTLTVTAVNAQGSSKIVGDDYKKYDLVIVYSYMPSDMGPVYRYSVYSDIGRTKDTLGEFTCNRIAELFNGGGHPGAAGFSTCTNILEQYSLPVYCKDKSGTVYHLVVEPLKEDEG